VHFHCFCREARVLIEVYRHEVNDAADLQVFFCQYLSVFLLSSLPFFKRIPVECVSKALVFLARCLWIFLVFLPAWLLFAEPARESDRAAGAAQWRLWRRTASDWGKAAVV
jgi:hypothetical protein